MRRLLITVLVGLWTLVGASAALAQCGTSIPGGTVCGNPAGSQGLNNPVTHPVLGIPNVSTGQMGFAGSSGGTATIAAQAAAGTPTLLLPTTSGTFPSTAASPLVLNAVTGVLSCPTCVSGTGGALINGTTPTTGYTTGQILGSTGSVLSAYSVTGTGNVVLSNTPTLTGTPTVQGLTTTQPGWYAQLTGDTNARVRVGLNSTDTASIAFGPGNAVRDTFIERAGVATLRFGAPDSAAPAAQTFGFPNVATGTSNTAAPNFTFNCPRGTGTGIGGDCVFQVAPAGSSGASQNSFVTALILSHLGYPTAPTASLGTNTTQLATTAFVQSALSGGLAVGDAITGGTPNGLFYNSANTLGNLATANNGVLVTDGSGVPSILFNAAPINNGQFTAYITPQYVGAKCDGVTDDTTLLQAAVNNLPATGGIVYTPPGSVCLTSSTIIINKPHVTLLGVNNKNDNLTAPSKWIYTGTGARFIDARDSHGFRLDGMQIVYSSASFTGSLVDLSGITPGSSVSAYASIHNSFLGPSAGRTGTATLANLSGTVDATLEKSYFYHGAPSILGETSINQNSRTTMRGNTFGFNDGFTISSCGLSWVVEGNSFEPSSAGQASTFTNISSLPCQGGIWSGNFFGDVTADGGTWISGYFQGTQFTGNQMAGPSGVANTTGISLNTSKGVVIKGNRFELLTNAVNCVASNEGVQVNANDFVNVTTEVANPSNCAALNTDGNSPQASQQGNTQIMIGQTGTDPLPKTISGDGTLSAAGALVVTKTNGTAFGALATVSPGTGVAIAAGNATNGASGFVTFNGNIGTTATGHASLDLPLSGGTMSGNIAMGGNAITGGGAITGTSITGSINVISPTFTSAGVPAVFSVSGAPGITINGSGPPTGVWIGSTTVDEGANNLGVQGTVFLPNVGTDAAATDATACIIASTGKVAKGSGTLGICLGTSGAQFKTAMIPMAAGIDEIEKLPLINYRYKEGFGDNGERIQYGLTAQDVEKVMPDLVRHDENGDAINFDIGAMLPVALHAIQQLKADNDNLRACQDSWKCRIFGIK